MKWKIFTYILLIHLIISGSLESIKISDFNDYYSASKNFLKLEDIYYLDKMQGVKKENLTLEKIMSNPEIVDFFKGRLGSYIYPPIFAFLLIPLSFLDYKFGSFIWFLINYIALIGIFYFLSKKFNLKFFSFASFAILLINFKFIQSHQSNNQVGLLLLLFILIAIISQKDILSSFFLSLAVVIKLTPAIFFIYFLYKKRYKVIIFSFIFMLFLFLLPSLYNHEYNLKMIFHWYDFVIENSMQNPAFRAWKNNQSLIATLSKYFIPYSDFINQAQFNLPFFELSKFYVKVINIIFSFLFLCLFALCFFKKVSDNCLISILFISSLVLSGISWLHSFVFLIFPSFYIYTKFDKINQKEKYFIYGMLFVFFIVNKNIVGNIIESLFFMYSWLLYINLALLIFIYRVDLKYKLKN